MSYNKAWEVAYNRDRARGRKRYVPAAETRARLQDLVDAQVPLRAIARAARLSDTVVRHLVAGHHDLVQRHTADRVALLALADVYDQASGNVPSIGATRRVRALMAIGWRKADLQAQGVPSGQLVTRARAWISVAGWRQTRDVYDRLSMTPGPSQACRDRARSHGYAPPLAWDQDTIDDPRASPQMGGGVAGAIDPVAVDRVVAAARAGRVCGTSLRLTQDERLDAIRKLAASGCTDGDIALAVGVSDRTVLRLRQHYAIAPGVSPARPAEDPEGNNRLHRAVQRQQAGFTPSGPDSARPAKAIGV